MMPIHFIIYFFLIFSIMTNYYVKKHKIKFNVNILFFIGIALITSIAVFRYGMGTDFFGYSWHYKMTPDNLEGLSSYSSHMDSGFQYLMYIFRAMDLSYPWFTGFLSLFMYGTSGYIIYKYSKFRILSLFILFTAGYFEVYFNSGLRQGLAMVIFLFAFYEFFLKGKTIKYLICIAIATTFHKASLIALIIPIIKIVYRKLLNTSWINIALIIFAFGFLAIGGARILESIFNSVGATLNYSASSPSILAIALRIILLIIIYILYNNGKHQTTKDEKLQIYIYFACVIIFIMVANNPILSRFTDFIMIIEIILIPNLISNTILNKSKTRIILLLLITIYSTLLFKDMSASLEQGRYYDKNILNYPYVNSIDKNHIEKILTYRYVIEAYTPGR